ncbi:short-chain dehydrogenase, partial [Burkholderia sp. Ax-1735]|nr:short-chain dehydrogenase [Burkholderia sp. Ax-1735]
MNATAAMYEGSGMLEDAVVAVAGAAGA